jgi:hypothetical protein
MASIKDVEQVADDLENLVKSFRKELQEGPDFDRLIAISDEISEHADNAASTFNSMNEALSARIGMLNGGKQSGGSRSGGSRQKAESGSQ